MGSRIVVVVVLLKVIGEGAGGGDSAGPRLVGALLPERTCSNVECLTSSNFLDCSLFAPTLFSPSRTLPPPWRLCLGYLHPRNLLSDICTESPSRISPLHFHRLSRAGHQRQDPDQLPQLPVALFPFPPSTPRQQGRL